MRLRGSGKNPRKVEPPMAPLIDIVFLLLVFFLLTLQIRAHEGNVQIQMPIVKGCIASHTPSPVSVQLVANDDGSLKDVIYRTESLGVGEQAFEKLNKKIRDAVGYRAGHKALNQELQVEIEADYNLDYRYAVNALSACSFTREKSPEGNFRQVKLVDRIRFAPPRTNAK